MKNFEKFLFLFWGILGFFILDPGAYAVGVLSSALFLVFLAIVISRYFGVASLAFLFLFFFFLYSFSVPFSVIFDIALSSYDETLVTNWSKIDPSLISFSISIHIAIIGLLLAFIVSTSLYKTNKNTIKNHYISSNIDFLNISVSLGIISTVFQLINFFRVGGFNVLVQGKLIYQSAIADSSMMLPDERFFYFSVIFFILSLLKHQFKIIKIIIFIISNSAYLFINLYIGERGTLLTAIFMIFLTYFYSRPKIKIKLKYIFLGIFVYFIFVGITTYRSLFVGITPQSTKEVVQTLEYNEELIELLLNPANNEFGSPCLNYRMYYQATPYPDFKYGANYFHFLAQLLPEKINPFYDRAITTQFRDKFVPERGIGGSIGGTGYSAIMESYINFYYLGPILIYFLIFFFILKLESNKNRPEKFIYHLLIYVSSFELVLLFQRSSFEYVMIKYITIVLFSYLISKFVVLKK